MRASCVSFSVCYALCQASLVAQTIKKLPAMQEMQVGFPGRKWQPTPLFLPGESHGQGSLVGYSPWDCKESDTTVWLTHTHNYKKWSYSVVSATSFMGFPGGSVVKYLPANAGDPGSIPGSGWSPGKGHGNPLQYSCLENPMDREAWQATVYRVAKSWTQLEWLSTHTRTL